MRIPTIVFLGCLTQILSGCNTVGGVSNSSSFTPITDLSLFQTAVVGKRLEYKANHVVVINSDGTWGGQWGNGEIHGDWSWEDGAFCRTINTGRPRDCQIFALSDQSDKLKITRDRGVGQTFTYKILK